MRSKALPGWAHTLCTAAAALVFLLAYELVVYRVPVTEIFLPVSSWSDEVIYSKQLAAAVQREKLQKEIAKLEKLARAEKQPKRKFELVQKIHALQNEMEG